MDQEVRTSLAVSCLVWRLSRAVLRPRLGGRGCWGWGSMVRVVLGKMAVCGAVMLLLLCCILATHVPAQRSIAAVPGSAGEPQQHRPAVSFAT